MINTIFSFLIIAVCQLSSFDLPVKSAPSLVHLELDSNRFDNLNNLNLSVSKYPALVNLGMEYNLFTDIPEQFLSKSSVVNVNFRGLCLETEFHCTTLLDQEFLRTLLISKKYRTLF